MARFFLFFLIMTSNFYAVAQELCTDYVKCRDQFLKTALEISSVQVKSHPISKSDGELFVDEALISFGSKKLVVVVSGTHGVEGFVGSYVQSALLKKIAKEKTYQNHDFLFVHALNPWGFKHRRRVTENNVDLNRNFLNPDEFSHKKNQGYSQLNEFLSPQDEASSTGWSFVQFSFSALLKIAKYGMDSLRQSIVSGQYEFPQGIFYGGASPEPQQALLGKILFETFKRYDRILFIDLHTGYGAKGVLHLFPSVPDAKAKSRIEEVFAGWPITYGHQKDFYEVSGAVTDWVYGQVPPEKYFVPMVFEYGTMDSQKTMGSVQSLYRMRGENQMHWRGAASKNDEEKIKKDFFEMFAPQDQEWNAKVLEQTFKVFDKTLTLF